MPSLLGVAVAVGAAVLCTTADSRQSCKRPSGHRVGQCRFGVHGTPDLSRAEWRRRTGAEVAISVRIQSLAPNSGAGDEATWPVLDSLGAPIGHLRFDVATSRFSISAVSGRTFGVSSVRVRGRGCAADTAQQRRFTLVQLYLPHARSHGLQGFLALGALDALTTSGADALAAFRRQHGTGCGPSGRAVGRTRVLANPRVGSFAHARLSDGSLNSVDEYDAKPDFTNVVYFMTNTTSVSVGGIARGMVRVGTPVAKVDQFRDCDPNSDGTLTWRYWAIRTGNPKRPKIYGWIPARCPKRPSD